MTAADIVSAVFLGVGTAAVLLSCLGVLAGRNAYARLHYLGPAVIVGATACVLAVIAEDGLSQSGIKAILMLVVLLVIAPILSHATARAIHRSESSKEERGR